MLWPQSLLGSILERINSIINMQFFVALQLELFMDFGIRMDMFWSPCHLLPLYSSAFVNCFDVDLCCSREKQ